MPKKFWLSLFVVFFIATGALARGASIDELKNQIQSHQTEIQKLDEEIARYKTQLSQTKEESTSLKKEISRLETERAKLQADIAVTQNKISIANLNIQKLNQGIGLTLEKIQHSQSTLAEALRQVNEEEQISLAEFLVGQGTTAELWANLDNYQSLNRQIAEQIVALRANKKLLEGDKQQEESEKKQLGNLKDQLADQKKITESAKQTKNDLLSITKSKEANYQKLLADRLKKKQEVEAEVAKAEADLQYALDPSKLPTTGSEVLAWPLLRHVITQYFGNTSFAQSHQAVYGGKGHNGIDLAATVGDQVFSASGGQVLGTGNTDNTCQGASYGKWILIRHNNGLTTLYAHLSVIKVNENQVVGRGDTIGYAGNTGYSTGPHLHFSVYASDGVKISSLKSAVPGCGTYRLPIASYSAYLNPLNYLSR